MNLPKPKTKRGERVRDGALATGGVFVIIQSGISLLAKFWPDLPWGEIEAFAGSILAVVLGGGLAHIRDRMKYEQPTDIK